MPRHKCRAEQSRGSTFGPAACPPFRISVRKPSEARLRTNFELHTLSCEIAHPFMRKNFELHTLSKPLRLFCQKRSLSFVKIKSCTRLITEHHGHVFFFIPTIVFINNCVHITAPGCGLNFSLNATKNLQIQLNENPRPFQPSRFFVWFGPLRPVIVRKIVDPQQPRFVLPGSWVGHPSATAAERRGWVMQSPSGPKVYPKAQPHPLQWMRCRQRSLRQCRRRH